MLLDITAQEARPQICQKQHKREEDSALKGITVLWGAQLRQPVMLGNTALIKVFHNPLALVRLATTAQVEQLPVSRLAQVEIYAQLGDIVQLVLAQNNTVLIRVISTSTTKEQIAQMTA